MAYADDVVIVGKILQDVVEVYTSLVEQKINKMGLQTNEKKTKFMTVSRKPDNGTYTA